MKEVSLSHTLPVEAWLVDEFRFDAIAMPADKSDSICHAIEFRR